MSGAANASSHITRTEGEAPAGGLTFRPMIDDDLPFMACVYASTRAEELAAVPWSNVEKASFLDMQFRAQHGHYRAHYPRADWLVLLVDGVAAGRLYIERWSDPFRIIDVALLPEYRGKGLGTALLRDLLDEARVAGKAISIHVEKFNPARRLYQRLGFVLAADKGVYDQMIWSPTDQVKTAS